MRDDTPEVWRCRTAWRIPFDNHRAVRPVPVKLKVSDGWCSAAGAKAFCILRSVWETRRRTGRHPCAVRRAALIA